MSLCPIILAGGGGTRLWPLSREYYPKQFLNLFGEHTLLQETLLRVNGLEKEIDVKIGDEFVGKLVGDFLFKREINKETGQKYPICKHPNSRKSALELIEKICLNDSKYFTRVIEELKPHLIETDWRNNK